tara:strand:- start:1583 stop:2101 length:519 start_codon:yes stop_codon:yes gene_type:complete
MSVTSLFSQEEMLALFGGMVLPDSNKYYKKFGNIEAKPVNPEGEVIITKTPSSDGNGEEVETTHFISEGFVVKQGDVIYAMSSDKFNKRYTLNTDPDTEPSSGFKWYIPKGEVYAKAITAEDHSKINGKFMAPWNSEMIAHIGDFLVIPRHNPTEIYRIEKSEFEKTYKPKE